jgi:hypothetical protein
VLGLERELRDHKEQASSAKNKYADWNTELFAAQAKLLAEATKDLFELQTQHKIDRFRDYERQIEQHVKMQRLWYVIVGSIKGMYLSHGKFGYLVCWFSEQM